MLLWIRNVFAAVIAKVSLSVQKEGELELSYDATLKDKFLEARLIEF
jgi:hypothetical protein